MIDYEDYTPNKAYFAAANGFDGFRCYFDKLFNPKKFERIYILKGGPGTGKSTLMKGLIKYANNAGIFSEAIYCSSDPYSLDGVILTDNDKSVLIVDGTSPHSVEPSYPGAVERIVDLGEGFNIAYLTLKKNQIFEFAEIKKSAYSKAYKFLLSAGILHKIIYDVYEKAIDEKKLNEIIEQITVEDKKAATKEDMLPPDIFPVSAFGKFGYVRIDNLQSYNPNTILILGNGFSDAIIMKRMAEKLRKKSGLIAICPSPLSENIVDAIICRGRSYVSEGTLQKDPYGIFKSEPNLDREIKCYHDLLNLAKEAFSEASEYHFKLENIYRDGLEFTNNDKKFNYLVECIEKDLD